MSCSSRSLKIPCTSPSFGEWQVEHHMETSSCKRCSSKNETIAPTGLFEHIVTPTAGIKLSAIPSLIAGSRSVLLGVFLRCRYTGPVQLPPRNVP
jgi:hypothetical protein